MADVKKTITRTEDSGVDETGAAVQQETKRIQTEAAADPNTTSQNVVWFLLGIVEVLLALRFAFKVLGANPTNSLVNLVYSVTGLLTAPFDNIFGVAQNTDGATKFVFEPSIVVAAVVYALAAWGIVKLITINKKQ
jgi:hypothetical protein